MYNSDIKYIVKSLYKIMQEDGYSNLVINQVLNESDLTARDRRTHRQIVYGTIENWLYLSYVLKQFSKKKVKNNLRMLLMAGLYELLFLKGRKAHSVVNRYVDTAKVDYPYATKFVNAVLRNAQRNQIDLSALPIAERLSIQYSHPRWLVMRWLELFGQAKTSQILEANLSPKAIYLRVNRQKVTVDQLLADLQDAGVVAHKSEVLEHAIKVDQFNTSDFTELHSYKAGHFSVQDLSSMLVAEVLPLAPDARVLDLCAAPGGKAGAVAERLASSGKVIACDIHPHKIKITKDHAVRLGLSNLTVIFNDATKLNRDFIKGFDHVVLDAPCSGLGIISKKPEIKYRKYIDDIYDLAKIQENMLDIACKYVKIGGNLLYSTCTIDPIENEYQIDSFLKRHPNYQLLNIENTLDKAIPSHDGMVSILPNEQWSDGFFIAILTRKSWWRAIMKFGIYTASGKNHLVNEDFVIAEEALGIYIVCDGMGGHAAGELASLETAKFILDKLKLQLDKPQSTAANSQDQQMVDLLKTVLNEANDYIYRLSLSNKNYRQMGTTALVAYFASGDVYISHVGDSRAYLVNKTRISRLTKDHSYVQHLVDSGALRPEDAKDHPKRNMITQAIGAKIPVTPQIIKVQLASDDRLLLCSDGVSGALSERQIQDIICADLDLQQIAQTLVLSAFQNGGTDDASAIVVARPEQGETLW